MTTRIIAKLDVKPPYVVKPVHFEGLRKVGLPFELAKKYAGMQKLKNRTEWEKHFRTNKGSFYLESKKLLIPQRPDRVVFYQDKWNNWKDFLGDHKKK